MENETWTGASLAVKLAEGFFPLFYLLPPSWSSFATVAEVPDYVSKVSNEFLIFDYVCVSMHTLAVLFFLRHYPTSWSLSSWRVLFA